MAPDSMKNLGYGNEEEQQSQTAGADDNAIAANVSDRKKTMGQIAQERAEAAVSAGK